MKIFGKWGTTILVFCLVNFFFSIFIAENAVAAEKDTLRFGMVGQMVGDYSTDLDDMDVEWPSKMSVYEGLLRYKPGTLETEPCLATSWEVSDDGKEMTFHLRKGVQFHNGFGEMTAEDVKATYDRLFDTEKWTYVAEIMDDWRDLERVEVVDKYTVKLYLKNPDYTYFTYLLPHYTGNITSKKALDQYGPEGTKIHAIGTGPYELDEWIPMDKIKLKKFDAYWGDKARIENVEFTSFGNTMAAEKALESGQIDVAKVSRESLKHIQKNPDLVTHIFSGSGFAWIGMTLNKPPMDNIKMRQAIAHAINVDEILRFTRSEYSQDPTTLRALSSMPKFFPEAVTKEICPPYEYNPEKAKQLLKEAGYSGEELQLGASPPGDMDDMATIVQGQLLNVGIKCKLTTLDKLAFWDATTGWEKEGPFHIFVDHWYDYAAAPNLAVLNWVCGEHWNLMRWCNPEFDKLLARVKAIASREDRIDKFQELQKMMYDDYIAIWVDHGEEAWGYNKRVDIGTPLPCGYFLPQTMKLNQ